MPSNSGVRSELDRKVAPTLGSDKPSRRSFGSSKTSVPFESSWQYDTCWFECDLVEFVNKDLEKSLELAS